jgi:hypothetical protein
MPRYYNGIHVDSFDMRVDSCDIAPIINTLALAK